MYKFICCVALGLSASILWGQEEQRRDVQTLISHFLSALSTRDVSALRECWVEQPVAFLPVSGAARGKRLDNEQDFLQGWKDVFEAGAQRQSSGNQGPGPTPIEPKDMRIDFVSPDVAVVTFHLTTNPQAIGRRLFVVARTNSRWKITHLHASNLTLPAAK